MKLLRMLIVCWLICAIKIIQKFVVTSTFEKSYNRLQGSIRRKVDKALGLIEQDFRYPSLHTKKQRGTENIWEARVDDNYRFLFKLIDGTCYLLKVGPHKIVEN